MKNDNLSLSRSNQDRLPNGLESNEKATSSAFPVQKATILRLTREMIQAEIEALERALEILESDGELYHPGQFNPTDQQVERLQERIDELYQALDDDAWLEERFLNGYEPGNEAGQ